MVACVVTLALFSPSGAAASSSGEITRAEVSADWATASFAGSAASSTSCNPRGPKPPEGEWGFDWGPPILPDSPPWECGWIPFATIGPGTSLVDCSAEGRRWNSIGEGVQLVWSGAERVGGGSASFDLDGVALTYGSQTPLLCLAAVEAVEGVVCQAEGCPEYAILHTLHVLDSAVLEMVTPELPGPTPDSTGPFSLQPLPLPTAEECDRRKSKARKGRVAKDGKTAVGQQKLAAGRARPMRRCKTG